MPDEHRAGSQPSLPSLPPIWFLRHGQTLWNAEGRIQGQRESPLTQRGLEQAAAQAALIAPVMAQHAPACFVSPLGRAQHTARIALAGAGFVTDPRLAEAHAGRWQGLLRADVIADPRNGLASEISGLELFLAAPGGEGYAALCARVAGFLRELDGPCVIVGHGLWGQVMRGLVLGLPRPAMGALPNAQGCIYHLASGRERVLRAPPGQD